MKYLTSPLLAGTNMDNTLITIIGIFLTAGLGFVGWYIKKLGTDITSLSGTVNQDIEKIKENLTSFKIEVSKDYMTKFEFTEFKKWLMDEFREVKDLIKDKKDKD